MSPSETAARRHECSHEKDGMDGLPSHMQSPLENKKILLKEILLLQTITEEVIIEHRVFDFIAKKKLVKTITDDES